MTDPAVTEIVVEQGKALVRAIEAMGTIEPTGWFERAIVGLIMAAYKEHLRSLVAVLPDWVTEEIKRQSTRWGE